MIAPLAVDPVLFPITPPTAAPVVAPITAPRSLLFMLAHADIANAPNIDTAAVARLILTLFCISNLLVNDCWDFPPLFVLAGLGPVVPQLRISFFNKRGTFRAKATRRLT
jgi:hypothetical protein